MDKYQIIKQIGKGSFGLVHVVKCKEDSKLYVMKEIPLRGLTEQEAHGAYQEAQLLSHLRHPCIVGYKESLLDQSINSLLIVLEYCDAGDLSGRLSIAIGVFFY